MFEKTALAAVFVAALLMPAPSAYACRCDFPDDWGFIGPKSGRMPANAAGVAWYRPPNRTHQSTPHTNEDLVARFTVEIFEFEAGKFRSLPVKVSPVKDFPGIHVIAPEGEGLKTGATYRFTDGGIARKTPGHKQVLVTIDRETLSGEMNPTLDIGPVTTEYISVAANAPCFSALKVSQVSVEAKMAQETQQWREQLLYRTIVDGEINWYAEGSMCAMTPPGRSWEAVGHDRIFAACHQIPRRFYVPHDLASGRHTLMMQAFLPGTGVVLETAVESVNLRCPWF